MARLSGGGGVLSIDHDYVLPLREIDVPTLILWGSRIPLPARRTGAARGSDPRCHLEGLPRDRPRGSLGPTGVGRPGPGRVHARYSSRLVGSPPNKKEVDSMCRPEHIRPACRMSWSLLWVGDLLGSSIGTKRAEADIPRLFLLSVLLSRVSANRR